MGTSIDLVNNKISTFSYISHELIRWYSEKNIPERNDLSKLKSIKLLFFICACSINESKQSSLFDVFNEFHAMPYGPVETDIYNAINNNNLSSIKIDTGKTTIQGSSPILPDKIKSDIDDALLRLKNINYDMVFMRAFDLVEISHRWISWQIAFQTAKNKNGLKEKMDVSLIKKDRQLFHLRPF